MNSVLIINFSSRGVLTLLKWRVTTLAETLVGRFEMLRSLSPLSRQTSITPSINDRWAIVSSAHTYRIYFCSHLRQEKLYCYDNMKCHLYQLNEKDTPFKKSFLTLLSTKVYKPCMINGFFLYFFFISQRIVSIHGLVSTFV